MRFFLSVALTLSVISLPAQNGYIKLENDSVLFGYLRYYVAFQDGYQGFELWKTKHDKEPLKIPKKSIAEYAIKKDTFKIFHAYKPFHDRDVYFEMVDAELKSSGKVDLYVIKNYQRELGADFPDPNGSLTWTPARSGMDIVLERYTYLYILENKKTGLLKALPSKSKELKEILMDFFPERYIVRYSEEKGPIKYESVLKLVKLYNSK